MSQATLKVLVDSVSIDLKEYVAKKLFPNSKIIVNKAMNWVFIDSEPFDPEGKHYYRIFAWLIANDPKCLWDIAEYATNKKINGYSAIALVISEFFDRMQKEYDQIKEITRPI